MKPGIKNVPPCAAWAAGYLALVLVLYWVIAGGHCVNLLHVDSSILGPQSVSRTLSADIVAKLKAVQPDARVAYQDFAADPLPHLGSGYVALTRDLSAEAALSAADRHI